MLAKDDATTSILVVQPRRLAAKSIAKRVAAEMGDLGHTVGYLLHGDKLCGKGTRIIFCTAGFAMKVRRIVQPTILSNEGISHIDVSVQMSAMEHSCVCVPMFHFKVLLCIKQKF